MDGTPVTLDVGEGGGPCGEWTEAGSEPAIAMTGRHAVSRKHE
jgi:hypothetical protein